MPFTQARIHRELQAHYSTHTNALVVMPRWHGKTEQTLSRVLWELGRNPSLRIKIVCATHDLAEKRVAKLKEMIVTNQSVREIFPNLLPDMSSWGKTKFTVKRDVTLVDNSVEAYGVLSAATGGRCDLLVLDDITDLENSLRSGVKRIVIVETVDNKWMNLVHPVNSRVWWVGTPWHFDDAMQRKVAQPDSFSLLKFAINDQLDPIWPEVWPRHALAKKKLDIGTMAFTRACHCQPISGEEQVLRPEWFRFWTPDDLPKEMDYYYGVDPAFTEGSKSDDTGIVVAGVADNRIYVLETINRRGMTVNSITATLEQLAAKFPPFTVAVETNSGGELIYRSLVEHTMLPLTRIKTVKDKYSRFVGMAKHFENGRVYLRANGRGVHASQQTLYDQLIQFPSADHDDLGDALEFVINMATVAAPTITWG